MASMHTVPSDFANTGVIHCYECGHEYDHLGEDAHPGVCPDCASRAVDVVEPISIEDAHGDTYASGHSLVHIVVTDATDREIHFEFALNNDRKQAVLEIARFEGDRISPELEGWDHGIVPNSLTEQINEKGYEVLLSQIDSPACSD